MDRHSLEMPLKRNPLSLRCAVSLAVLLSISLTACNTGRGGADVVASVDGRKIYRSEMDKYYTNQTAGSDQKPSAEQETSLRLSIVGQLIETEILMHRAGKLGLIASDEEVDRKLNEIKSPYTAEQFDARLKEKKITLEDFKLDLKRSLTRDKVLNKEITSQIAVTDQDVADYYNAHKSEFNLIEPQYHISQIFVTPAPNAQVHNLRNDKAQNEADARKKIQMITNRLDSGDDFATLAMNYSEDPETSGNGGDLGFTPESSLKNTDPLTRDAVMKLKPGQYSPVIVLANPTTKQVFGFRIVKLIAKEPAGQRDLNDPRVQQAIRQQMRDRREQLLKAAYYEVLRNEAKINNYFADDVLKNAGSEKK